ncbi:dTDP-4-amino-4,6-dideoxygalactose transaminase [Fervidobacterium changbaicum]|uniref:PLP-dependent enzyme possibly involved in cell wall biogenesis n=2 Tax=Fervidobacterium TaxID=2422 RepID=H9U9T3_FERPD|nr:MULTISPECIES: DegT/DnrJ/EryC1/StrS family aminotransferase [Fervidobacterium]AFG34276.1 putative PLP-dependent enzyme possibly involved in cell wall biogenesis [Fervidobacterium pennivorans DSM 9078]QAV33761.1 DegT/DnrJ/EryC1/StrS family aminotransferase [Fervidobacterium changbaicum]SDH32452.1 dTDP-4-amino-4,6-dideoxygalactose transaminase [Fervidobacterium changbaicum]
MINVTRSMMPDFEKYQEKIKKLWETRWLTNNGDYLVELERRLSERFDTQCVIVSNGTLALLIAIELFDFPKGSEIIVTPFTFAATVEAIIWQGYKPVFADIDPETFNISPEEIEKRITEKTVAIMPVHVFGNPCNVEEIQDIAEKHNLRVIYDAAHCFDVFYEGKSVYKFGDISVASFHATKVFHTIEGGAIFSDNSELIEKARRLRNFGFNQKVEIVDVGINAKMNEFQAAMGLLNLEIVDEEIEKRKRVFEKYRELLGDVVDYQKLSERLTKYNYIYMPVLFADEKTRDNVFEELRANSYNTRKYFYPSLNSIFSRQSCPNSESVSSRILHLPLYGDLEDEHIENVCIIIKRIVGGK